MVDFEGQVKEHILESIRGLNGDSLRFVTAFVAAANIADSYTQMAYKKEPPDREIACKKGCDSCCTGIIGEGLSICEAELMCIKEMVGEIQPVESGCPFLKDSLCSIYQYRPVICRGMNSYDVRWCENPPLLYSVGPEGDAPIYHPQYYLVKATHRALCAALDQKPFRLKERLENGGC